MRAVFIAGPYMGADKDDIEGNIRRAEEFAVELWNRGYGVFCPHLNTRHFEEKSHATEEAYKQFDRRMLSCCDAVLAIPGWEASQGAKSEVAESVRLDIPVYYEIHKLVEEMPPQ